MKNVAISIMATVVLATLSFGAPKESTFTGEIMDSECAKVGSHEMMMKKEGAKNATQCSLACVKMGSKYVLFNAAEKIVYQLDRPEEARTVCGHEGEGYGYLRQGHRYHPR